MNNAMKSNTDLWVDEMVKRHGWYLHFDFMAIGYPYLVNIHTHGLSMFDHLDLQICFPLTKEDAYVIVMNVVEGIKNGRRFAPGLKYRDILYGFDMEFAEAKEDGRNVLRMIFPDKYGNIRGELSDQWKGCRIYFTNN